MSTPKIFGVRVDCLKFKIPELFSGRFCSVLRGIERFLSQRTVKNHPATSSRASLCGPAASPLTSPPSNGRFAHRIDLFALAPLSRPALERRKAAARLHSGLAQRPKSVQAAFWQLWGPKSGRYKLAWPRARRGDLHFVNFDVTGSSGANFWPPEDPNNPKEGPRSGPSKARTAKL